jgi:hypothetical protein
MRRSCAASWAVALSLLVLVSPSMVAGVGQTGVQTASVKDCARLLGRGWDDRCLLERLRDPRYFGIVSADASHDELLAYIRSNSDKVAALLFQVEYGRSVERFLKHQDSILVRESERVFLRALEKSEGLGQSLELMARALSALAPSAAAIATAESLGVLRQILFGIRVYQRFEDVWISLDLRYALQLYFEARLNPQSGQSESQEHAWNQALSTYGPVLEKIARTKRISVEQLSIWFENAFVAYRLVAYPDSDRIRHAQGLAIARPTRRLPDIWARVDFSNFSYPITASTRKELGLEGTKNVVTVRNGEFESSGPDRDEAVVVTLHGPKVAANPGAYIETLYVYTMREGYPALLGMLGIRDVRDEHDWDLLVVKVEKGMVITEHFSGAARCCPENIVRKKFRWNGSRFVLVEKTRSPWKPDD